jgi:hypothetical protein
MDVVIRLEFMGHGACLAGLPLFVGFGRVLAVLMMDEF